MHTNGALTVDIYFKDDPGSGIVLSDVRAGSLEEADHGNGGGGGSSYKKKGSRDECIILFD